MKTKWVPGETIRQKENGHAYIVLSTHYKVGSIIADLSERHPVPVVLFERDYDDFARDCDMRQIGDRWEYEGQFEQI